jgi:hypothetical protein
MLGHCIGCKNFDNIDKLMLKRKADDEFKIIVLKQRMFSKMVRALHSCITTCMSVKIRAMGKPSAQDYHIVIE